MLILLPPSETKRDGGVAESSLDLSLLSYPGLTSARRTVLAATRTLSRNLTTMAAALKLGPSQHFELVRNRQLRSSPTMPAIDRYTGVLYDALGASTLDERSRAFAVTSVLVHSAMFGLVGAADPIPAYRLSHDSRLPAVSLRRTWQAPISLALGVFGGLILDLRSEGYVALGPVPQDRNSFFLRLVSEAPDGQRRPLNHFNKKGKGEFVRALLTAGIDHATPDSLLEWAAGAAIRLDRGARGELVLTV